ncbi:MAG: TolC family protein, partial [Parvibaculaceae bacterium]|nr:TolC family protein [Parvibaculaceae bacterium]
MYTYIFTGALLLAGLGGGTAHAQPQSLSLSQAVYLARQANDPTVARFENKATALEERGVALSQLPDPTVRGSVENLPLDSFRLDQENMTQVRMSVRQAFPAGNTLVLKGQKSREKAAGIREQKKLVLRKIDLSIRIHWYDLFYWTRAQSNLQKNRRALKEMIEALQGSFASGNRLAQHVLRVEFELSLLEDQLAEMKRRADRARAELRRYIGSAADQPLPSSLPEQSAPQGYAQLEENLKQHPAVLV